MKPAWPGPIEGGITQSLISRMLECPYRSFLYYGLGLEESTTIEPNLIYGNGGHLALEIALMKPKLIREFTESDFDEIFGKVVQYFKDKYPNAPSTYPHSIIRILKLYDDSYKTDLPDLITEKKFNEVYITRSGMVCNLRGKKDVHSASKRFLGEHKFKGKIDPELTRLETPVDQQVLLYSYVSNSTTCMYDQILIPESQWSLPKRNPMSSAKGYMDEIFYNCSPWNDFPIARYKNRWISQLPIDITDEAIDEFRKKTLDPIIDMIWRRYDKWCDSSFDPENPACYDADFYKVPVRQFDATRTERYKCKYHGILTGQIGLSDLVPVTDFYKELTDE